MADPADGRWVCPRARRECLQLQWTSRMDLQKKLWLLTGQSFNWCFGSCSQCWNLSWLVKNAHPFLEYAPTSTSLSSCWVGWHTRSAALASNVALARFLLGAVSACPHQARVATGTVSLLMCSSTNWHTNSFLGSTVAQEVPVVGSCSNNREFIC